MLKPVELRWGRFSTAKIYICKCRECGQFSRCLVLDTSDGEYGSVEYCLPCLQDAFTAPKKEPTSA